MTSVQGVWPKMPPFIEKLKDRWLRITWAARHYKIDRDVLFGWVKGGEVEGRQATSGQWLVLESSLRDKLFGKGK